MKTNLPLYLMTALILILTILNMATILKIKDKIESIKRYLDDNHYTFIRTHDRVIDINNATSKLSELTESLDAKKNFVEGLEFKEKTK